MAWNRPSNKVKVEHGRRKFRPYNGLIAAAIIVVGAIFAWMMLRPSGTSIPTSRPTSTSLIKAATPALASKRAEKPEQKPDDGVPPGFQRASNGTLHPAGLPYRPEWKKTHAVISNNFYGVAQFDEIPYRNATEQMLVDIFSCRLGEMPPMQLDIPPSEKKHLVEILLDKNEITKDDSEALAVGKDILTKAKKELIAYIKGGGTPDAFFEHCYRELEMAHLRRMDAIEEIHRIGEEEGDPEIALQLQKKVNEKLRAEGILPVKAHLELGND